MDAPLLRRRTVGLLLAASLGATAACAGGGSAESPFDQDLEGSDQALIVVDNTRSSVSEMTVYLQPSSGVRVRLGAVTLDTRESFTVEDLSWGGSFRLEGDRAGSDIVSQPFTLSPGNVIEWDVHLNRIHFGGRSGG